RALACPAQRAPRGCREAEAMRGAARALWVASETSVAVLRVQTNEVTIARTLARGRGRNRFWCVILRVPDIRACGHPGACAGSQQGWSTGTWVGLRGGRLRNHRARDVGTTEHRSTTVNHGVARRTPWRITL